MSDQGDTRPSSMAVSRRLRLIVAAIVVVAAMASVVVAVDPGTTLVTRDLTVSDPGLEAATEHQVAFTSGEELAATVVVRSQDVEWGRSIQVTIERPRPALHSLSIRLGTQAAGLAPHEILLATPSGDWPELTYDTTRDGDVIVAADGIGWTSTSQLWFYVPAHAVVDDWPAQINVQVDTELAGRPSLTSWRASTNLPLHIGGAGPGSG